MKVLKTFAGSFAAAAALTLCLTNSASAGKPERDKADELKPKIEETQTAVKTACGCDVHVNVKWENFLKVDDMVHIPDTLEGFTTAAKGECQKESDKKAFCDNVTDLEITYGYNLGGVQSDGKKLTATSNDSRFDSDSLFTSVMSKF